MPYQIRVTSAAQKDLMGFTEPVRDQIRSAIRALAEDLPESLRSKASKGCTVFAPAPTELCMQYRTSSS